MTTENCDEQPPCDTDGECCEGKKAQIKSCCPGKKGCPKTKLSSTEMGSDDSVKKYHLEVEKLSTDTSDGKPSEKDCYYKRKCILHPYGETGEGCCKGQTGHHIVPDSAFAKLKDKYCYVHGRALTVCVSGAGNNVGNHGLIHNRLCRKLAGKRFGRKKKITFSDLLKEGIAATKETLKDSGCDWGCLKNEVRKNHLEMHRTKKKGNVKKGCDKKNITGSSRIDKSCGISEPGDLKAIKGRMNKILKYVKLG